VEVVCEAAEDGRWASHHATRDAALWAAGLELAWLALGMIRSVAGAGAAAGGCVPPGRPPPTTVCVSPAEAISSGRGSRSEWRRRAAAAAPAPALDGFPEPRPWTTGMLTAATAKLGRPTGGAWWR
jgi:hypothetical protein